MKYLFSLLGILLIAAFAQAQNYPVGVRTMTYVDGARSRTVTVEVHYPATSTGSNTSLASDSFPFVVFGHGFQMTASAYYPFADTLAQRGFIVAFPNTESGLLPSHPNFAQDIIYVYNTLVSENSNASSPFYHHVVSKGAIAGHSMGGGSAVLSAQYSNPAVCYFTMAEANTNPSSITAAAYMTKPYLSFAGSYDCIAPYAANQQPTYDSSTSPCKILIDITGASHCQFGAGNVQCNFGEGVSGCANPPLSRSNQINTVLRYLIPYLSYHLKGICSAWTDFEAVYSADVTNTKTRNCTVTVPSNALINGPSYFCAGSSNTLSAQPTGFQYHWSNGSTTDSISISTGGSYSISVSNGTCSITAPTLSVSVTNIPQTPGIISGVDTLCLGGDSIPYSIAAVAGSTSYNWSVPQGWSIIGAGNGSSIYLHPAHTSGTVSVHAANICGVSDSSTLFIVTDTTAVLTGSITGTDTLCSGNNAQTYTFTGSNTGALTWSVSSPYSISSGQSTTAIQVSGISASGTLTLTASSYCGQSVPLTYHIAVIDTPQPSVIRSNDTLFSTISGSSYQWYFNGQMISGATNAFVLPANNGSYSVVVTNANGCTGHAASFAFSKAGINDLSAGYINVYPNPASDILHIESDKSLQQFIITDMTGKQVLQAKEMHGNAINISSLSQGIYTLQMTNTEGSSSTFRICKQ